MQLGEKNDLSPKQLSLQISDAHVLSSISELQALDLWFHHYTIDEVWFNSPLIKTHYTRAYLKELPFASSVGNDKLCVVQCLKQYKAATNQ